MKTTAQPPVIRVGGNIYVLAETSFDQYKAKLNAVSGDIHSIASEVMTILDKAKMGPANALLQRNQKNDPGEHLDKEDKQILETFMKFWEEASGVLGTFVGEFSEVPFEEGHGRDLPGEEAERRQEEDYEDEVPMDHPYSRYSSSIGSQLSAAYGQALAKLDEFMDVFGRILPLLRGWDRLAKEVSSEDPSKAEELSDILEELMSLKDLGSKVAELAMSADYIALQPQVHARTADGTPKYAFVRFPRFITVKGSLYKVNIDKTNEYRMRSGVKAPPLTNWSSDSPSWDQEACKKRLKSLGSKFEACVKKSKWSKDPEGFCARLEDCALDTTYWRGKGKKRPYKKESSTSELPKKIRVKGVTYILDSK